MHPGIHNLNDLSINQIEEKIQQLSRYYFMAQNQEVRHQIILTIDTYKIELQERKIAQREKEKAESGDSGLDGLINIS